MAFRILVADDHEVVRRGVCAVLRARKDWELCQATDGREAVTTAKQMRPDIVILDIGMPNLNGLAAARQILRDNLDQKIIILTIDESDQLVDELLKAGVRGYVLKIGCCLRPRFGGGSAFAEEDLFHSTRCPEGFNRISGQ